MHSIEVIQNAIASMESMSIDTPLEKVMVDCMKELIEYRKTKLTPKVCMNYKLFEDECIRDGVQFKDILTLKDIVKGMTCETCRNTGMCSIELDYGVKYCSDWERKDG